MLLGSGSTEVWLGQSERQAKGLYADFAARETLDATATGKG